ncbi:hypothetical protein G6011_09727 [Alternaria panax]|uniref:Uncharacterized protein n=1 Tax=Alternaria panax TaxID=48097 RepID=A0AAD4FFJ9_9PLEO|nr:hypothetical protein G6011_09727 [Alternaria panax]
MKEQSSIKSFFAKCKPSDIAEDEAPAKRMKRCPPSLIATENGPPTTVRANATDRGVTAIAERPKSTQKHIEDVNAALRTINEYDRPYYEELLK